MSSRAKNIVFSRLHGAKRCKVTSISNGGKRQKSTFIKDSFTAVNSSRSTNSPVSAEADVPLSADVPTDVLFEQPPANKSETYAEKRLAVSGDWQEVRDGLQKGFIESCIPGFKCTLCTKTLVNCRRISCDDCGPGTVYCEGCCEHIHSTVCRYHIPLIWPVPVSI